MSESMNSVAYLLLSACVALLAAGLTNVGAARRARLAAPVADAVFEPDHGDFDRFMFWFAPILLITWGLSWLPIERIGLTAPGWVSYAGAIGIAIGACREMTDARKGKGDQLAGRLFMAALGCFWAVVHIHELLEGKLW